MHTESTLTKRNQRALACVEYTIYGVTEPAGSNEELQQHPQHD